MSQRNNGIINNYSYILEYFYAVAKGDVTIMQSWKCLFIFTNLYLFSIMLKNWQTKEAGKVESTEFV